MGLRNIAVTITGDGSSLAQALRRSATEVDQLGRDVERTNERTKLSWKTAGAAAAAAGAIAVTGLVSVGTAAAEFETRMRNVNSIVQDSEAQFRATSASVIDISRTLPQSANTLAEGLYEISSSGFLGADGLLVLSKAAAAASAGLTDTDTSAKAISAVLNAYGLSAASAGDVSDTLFQTVNLGVISFEELSGAIGDVVGTAAAAQVNIAQVGAAIATMTLSGISGSEAATSLNRLLEASINPSEALASVYAQLGYESGAAALASKGLFGVLEDVREATGGNITTLLALFPEIRAARGALALMSDEGRTYQRVSAAIEDENVRLGATQKALNEQMKAAKFQFKLFRNEAEATAIEVGGRVLPVFVSFLKTTKDLGDEAVPLLQRGITAVTPAFDALRTVGGDVVQILGTLVLAAGPAVAALLGIAGGTLLTGLTALAEGIADVTGFLADNQTVVLALAAAYAATLVPALATATVATITMLSSVAGLTVAFNRFILTPVILGLTSLIGVAGGATAAVSGLTAAMISLQAFATLGIAAILFAGANAFRVYGKAGDDAAKQIAESTKDFDAFDTNRAQQQIAALREETLGYLAVGKDYEGLLGQLRAGSYNIPIFGDKRAVEAARLAEKGIDRMREMEVQAKNAQQNVDELTRSTGLTADAIRKLATDQKIDLAGNFEDSNDERLQILSYLRDTEKQSGLTGKALADAGALDLAAVEKLNGALKELQEKAASAFASSANVLGSFDPQAGAAEVEAATQRVKEAERALADVRERQAGKEKRDVSDAMELRKAQEGLAEARVDAGAARGKRQEQTLEASYKRAIEQASKFSQNLAEATARGLDPAAVAKLLQEGPAQAGPILEQLVADQSGRLIRMVNAGEAALRDINSRVVEQARIVALAVNSQTDELSRNVGLASRISAEAALQGGAATIQSVAAALRVPAAEVLEVARLFGLTIAATAQQGIDSGNLLLRAPQTDQFGLDAAREEGRLLRQAAQMGIDSAPLSLPALIAQGNGDFRAPGSKIIARAGGGLITGPGTGTSDSILARLSDHEFVQRRAAVDYYGVDFMQQLNRLQIPRFAAGGPVGAQYYSSSAPVTNSTQHTVKNSQEIAHVDVHGVTMQDAIRELGRRQRQNAWSGGARGGMID